MLEVPGGSVGIAWPPMKPCKSVLLKKSLHCIVNNTIKNLQRLEKAPSKFLREYYFKIFGINESSHLQDAPFFDVCEQFPQDIMHVFLEGVLAYEIKYLLRHYINEEGVLTLSDLNKEIQTLSYGYSHIKDKPCVIKTTDLDLDQQSPSNLGQGAASMWLWLTFCLLF